MNIPSISKLKPKVKIYGLVRDQNGKPKIDDPKTLHPAIKAMLTPEEREELGVSN